MGLYPKNRDLTRPPSEVELRVDASDLRTKADELKLRLDAFLAHHLTWRSRSSIQGLIESGHVWIDASAPDRPRGSGELALERRPGRKLRHGSRVVVVIPEELRLPMLGPSSDELVILYEDEAVLAVDKPPDVAVHPSGRHLTDTLIQRVHAKYGGGQPLETGTAPRLCHRLDRETSGIVLIGKDPIAHADVMGQFEHRRVKKEYLAIVHGTIDRDRGTIDMPIGACRTSKVGLKMSAATDGQASRTDWIVVERLHGHTLVSCLPLTGRQHQIRVHLEAIGHPVVGDKLYGVDEALFEKSLDGALTAHDHDRLGMPRQALHHHRVRFRSPHDGEIVEVTSQLPGDMGEYVQRYSRSVS
ncbi:MAG: RluA family pseudouridine synthase [Planctomycetota bacterium]